MKWEWVALLFKETFVGVYGFRIASKRDIVGKQNIGDAMFAHIVFEIAIEITIVEHMYFFK